MKQIPTGQHDPLPRWLKKQIRERDTGFCQQCLRDGKIVEGTEIDHIIPRAEGGTHEPENLELLCHECHRHKTQTQLGNIPRGSCIHGIAYTADTRCPECPATHREWRRSEEILPFNERNKITRTTFDKVATQVIPNTQHRATRRRHQQRYQRFLQPNYTKPPPSNVVKLDDD